MIAVQHLVKKYGAFTAVNDVTLDVPAGQIHGFLGPNGAGKTTTLRMIAGLLKPTAGRILVNDFDLAVDPERAKASLGFIPRESSAKGRSACSRRAKRSSSASELRRGSRAFCSRAK